MKRTSDLKPLLTKFIDRRFINFLVVGSVNTVLSYLIYRVLLLVFSYSVAYTAAYLSGIVISYFLSARWVFKQPPGWRSFFRFPLVYVVQYLSGLVLMYVFIELFHVPAWLAPLVLLPITIPLSFIIGQWVFRTRTS